jgi:hypothetical protein
MDVMDVFQTPYQSAPLDIRSPSFYHTRVKEINDLLLALSTCSNEELISMIGDKYRDNYRAQCVGVSWKIPLKSLQLIAVCIGGKGLSIYSSIYLYIYQSLTNRNIIGLSIIFRAYSVNYIHFSSGAPDLLLIRISKERKEIRNNSNCQPNKRKFDFLDNSKVCMDLSLLLGDSWKSLGSVDRVTRWGKKAVDDLDDLTEPLPQTQRKSRFNKNNTINNDNNNYNINSMKEEEIDSIMINQHDNDSSGTVMPVLSREANEGDNKISEGDNIINTYNPFQCNQTNLILPCNNDDDNVSNEIGDWRFECMFIEVKGPSDHLAQKQIIWFSLSI